MFPGSDSQKVIGISLCLLFALKPGSALVTHLGELGIMRIITIYIILIRLCACSLDWAR